MTDILVLGIIVLILGGAVWYILRQKKKGNRCIGCPAAKNCSANGQCPGCGK